MGIETLTTLKDQPQHSVWEGALVTIHRQDELVEVAAAEIFEEQDVIWRWWLGGSTRGGGRRSLFLGVLLAIRFLPAGGLFIAV
jgi:hypothetical protein